MLHRHTHDPHSLPHRPLSILPQLSHPLSHRPRRRTRPKLVWYGPFQDLAVHSRPIYRADRGHTVAALLQTTSDQSCAVCWLLALGADPDPSLVAALDKLHARHVLPGFSDRSSQERDIAELTTDITRACPFLFPPISSPSPRL